MKSTIMPILLAFLLINLHLSVQDENAVNHSRCSYLSINVGFTGGRPLIMNSWVNSALDCSTLCAEEEGCTAWTYVTDGFNQSKITTIGIRNCLLMAYHDGARYAPYHVSGRIDCDDVNTSEVDKYNTNICLKRDLEYLNSDVEVSSAKTFEDCRKLCLNNDSCNFWTFDPENNKCGLSTCNGRAQQTPGKLSGAKVCREAANLEDLPTALDEAIEHELSMCTADYIDCNIQITENKDILIPGCDAKQYPNQLNVQRVLSVEEGNIIELNIKEVHTDPFGAESCLEDKLAVYDGEDLSYSYHGTGPAFLNILKRACGNWTTPAYIYSSGNKMLLEFKSDFSGTGSGIRASYRAIDPSEHKAPEIYECGSHIFASSGRIKSPNYPNNYPNNAHCQWHIELPNKDGKIRWRFLESEVEAEVDIVVARDPLNNMTFLLDSYSPIGNQLIIDFTSDGNLNEKGFDIMFEEISDCGGDVELTSTSWTEIQSPNFQYPAPRNMTCHWTFNLAENVNLAVNLTSFRFGNDCETDNGDRIEFRDPDGLLLKSLCGHSDIVAFILWRVHLAMSP